MFNLSGGNEGSSMSNSSKECLTVSKTFAASFYGSKCCYDTWHFAEAVLMVYEGRKQQRLKSLHYNEQEIDRPIGLSSSQFPLNELLMSSLSER